MTLINGLTSLLLLAALSTLPGALRRLASTTLTPAGRWSLLAVAVWVAAWVGEVRPTLAVGVIPDILWYAAAVVALCPPLSVLGARRPNVRVWSWFVILPLIAVFLFPVLSPLILAGAAASVSIPTPFLLGFSVVLLMGTGNYVGTRYALPAALFAVSVCCIMGTLTNAGSQLPWSTQSLRIVATAGFSIAILWAGYQSLRPTAASSRLDRVWLDFRDTFGIVWGRRLLERFNQRAAQEGWRWRLAEFGFMSASGLRGTPSAEEAVELEAALRWFLRRFVEDEWYLARSTFDSAESSPPSPMAEPVSGRSE